MGHAQPRTPGPRCPDQRGTEPRRRDARQELAGAQVHRTHPVRAPFQIQRLHPLGQAPAAAGLQPGEAGRNRGIGVLGQDRGRAAGLDRIAAAVVGDADACPIAVGVAQPSGCLQRQVVAEAIRKYPDAGAVRPPLPGDRHVQVGRTFLAQPDVAHLVRIRGDVGPIGKELVVPRCALAGGQGGRQLPGLRQVPQGAQRRAALRERPLGRYEPGHQRVAEGGHPHQLGPRAQAQPAPAGRDFLVDESGSLARAAGRRKGLGTIGREARGLGLQADEPVQRPDAGMAQFQPQVVAGVAEHGAGHAGLELGMPVARVAEPEPDRADGAVLASQLPLQGRAQGTHADRDLVLRDRPVVGPVAVDRQPQVALRQEHRGAERAAVAARLRVADPAVQRRRSRPGAGKAHRHTGVAGIAVKSVGMQQEAVGAALQHQAGALLAAAAGIADVGATADAAFRAEERFRRDTVVDQVHDAADRIAAVQQHARAAQRLDALDRDRIVGYRMVVAQAGRIDAGAAVAQDPDAVTVQAADHRAAGVGPEVGTADAGAAVQRGTQRIAGAQQQAGAGIGRGRSDQVVGSQRIAGHGDRGQRPGGGCLGLRRHREQSGQGRDQWKGRRATRQATGRRKRIGRHGLSCTEKSGPPGRAQAAGST